MKLLHLFIIIFFPVFAKAQDTLVTFYDSDWHEIKSEKNAVYYRKLYQLSEDTWQAKDYFIGGNLQMTGQFKTQAAKEEKGVFIYYYKNGQIESTGLYVNGHKDGEWKAYYSDGKIKSEAIWDNQSCIIEKKWDEDGQMTVKENPYNFAEVNPEFPGGDAAMSKFIQENFKYPEKAREKGEEGTVYVEFVVKKDGSIAEVKTVLSASRLLDAEAERVIKAMPKWKPGEQNGEAVSVRYTVPFKCSLGGKSKKKKRYVKK
jgi:TonB family protein